MAFVQAVLQAYAQRGLDPAGALARAQIPPSDAQDATQRVTAVQFERLGYFCPDPDTAPGAPVFNRTIGLRDSWAKAKKG